MFFTMWLVIGAGMLTLLIAAMGTQKKDTCKDLAIVIKGVRSDDFFLDEADILKLLKVATKGKIKGQPKEAFDLQRMEELLESNQWVKDAQIYFDSRNVLHVTVTEREPVARVFTVNGRSFYFDDQAQMMGLSEKLSTRLPVFTGFPDKKMVGSFDSLLMKDIVKTALFISSNPFWSSQVAQINIDLSCGAGCREMEMIPMIGNHVVKVGDGESIESKFNRLFVFYKQVLSKSGFDKYKSIDVRFDGQVVAAKSENPKVDSVQLRKNVEKLLKQIKEMEELNEKQALLPTPTPMTPVMPSVDSSKENLESDEEQPERAVVEPRQPEKREGNKTKNNKDRDKKSPEPVKKRPRAVMSKRNQ
ncbi:FtsQ-type POTRA domain-containing protein [Terrimonas sp. NA20]|uniref:FtsQ-type POTRA domain-containing protein n=1 Tax=Terrimonas ginsenosidimutans TaxID=2908004 RepID=A0ABS9KVX9_9BACT|nr:FtsQ-type POTRA domain-containing protein [Terrimonas ginsenosidimutans]MCG2616491.1 FtsQ-type POTRA domain-containing protein [Terrimonas ginsenosidimutans]